MKTLLTEEPRVFVPIEGLTLKDMGDIELGDHEQVTFLTPDGRATDFTRMPWGFYLCNSVNWNLRRQGLKTALVVSRASSESRVFLHMVQEEKVSDYLAYLSSFQSEVVCWLDELFPAQS